MEVGIKREGILSKVDEPVRIILARKNKTLNVRSLNGSITPPFDYPLYCYERLQLAQRLTSNLDVKHLINIIFCVIF